MLYFLADIKLSDGFADPFLWYLYFKNGMRIINLDVIPNVVGGIPNRSPFCHLFFRVNDLVRSVAQKEFCLYITLGADTTNFAPSSFSKEVVSSEF